MRLVLAALLFLLPAFATAQDRGNTILVLDASGSMWGQIDGVNKIVIARDVITELLQGLPDDQNLGLTVYGHRSRGDCADIENLVAPGPNTRDAIAAAVAGVTPMGKTPMTDAVIAAAETLRYTEDKATVILISDGIETCNPDPCAAAVALEEAGIDFTVHVIGFDITDAEALRQMQCLADETGGLLRSASNADEFLAALREVVADPLPAPEPETPALAAVTLTAVLDDAARTPFPDPLTWTITGGDLPVDIADTGNVVRAEFGPGTYAVTAMSAIDVSVGTGTFSVLGSGAIAVTVLMPVPLPLATLDAPPDAPAGSTIMVGWTGPDENLDNIEVGLPGEPGYLSFAYVQNGNPVAVILPGVPGTYELRYRLHDSETIASQLIAVTEAALRLTAPDTAPIGSSIDVIWAGPNAQNDNIELGRAGEAGYLDFAYTSEGNPVQIVMPGQPGIYELRYRFRDTETLLTRVIVATDADLALTAPDAAPIGSTIEVTWAGPNAQFDNVELGRAGEAGYIDFAYTSEGNPVQIVMPGQPGDYELRYRFRDAETLLTRVITATAAELALTAPDTAPAGATIEVGWTGPDAPLDMIQVGPPGEAAAADYAYTEGGNPLRLILPAQPGTYELRYRFQDAEVIFTRPIIVTAAEVTLSAPDSAPAGSLLPVGWVGPNAALDNIRIGKPGEGTVSYAYVTDGNPLQLRLPMVPGSYELHYNFRDREVIATRAIEVTAIGAQLVAQPSVPAGGMVTIGWDGPNYDIDYIAIGRPGEAGTDIYIHTSSGNPLTLTAPLTAGDYEIRYVSGETVLTAVPLVVTAE